MIRILDKYSTVQYSTVQYSTVQYSTQAYNDKPVFCSKGPVDCSVLTNNRYYNFNDRASIFIFFQCWHEKSSVI